MKISLNGWQRLWVLVCVLYAIPVMSSYVRDFPTPQYLPHQPEFEQRLSPEAKSKLRVQTAGPSVPQSTDQLNNDLKQRRQQASRRLVMDDEKFAQEMMPNGHTILFVWDITQNDKISISEEYIRIIKKQLSWQDKVHHFLEFVGIWAVPAIAIYILGWSIGWVYKGFKRPTHR